MKKKIKAWGVVIKEGAGKGELINNAILYTRSDAREYMKSMVIWEDSLAVVPVEIHYQLPPKGNKKNK